MKNATRIFVLAAVAAAAVALFAGCADTDVVGKTAVTSFKAVADAAGSRVAWDGGKQVWTLASAAGDEVIFSVDFARNNAAGAADLDDPDVQFSFDAAPFVAAGLDVEKLPAAAGIKYLLGMDRFMYHFELGSAAFAPEAAKSLDGVVAEVVRTLRDRVGYHEKLDHYGIKLGNGNMFEWAKDLGKNDKDIVWVLDPAPFVAAGVDPARIAGWVYAKVEVKDDAGKTVAVDKLLKPFDLK